MSVARKQWVCVGEIIVEKSFGDRNFFNNLYFFLKYYTDISVKQCDTTREY